MWHDLKEWFLSFLIEAIIVVIASGWVSLFQEIV